MVLQEGTEWQLDQLWFQSQTSCNHPVAKTPDKDKIDLTFSDCWICWSQNMINFYGIICRISAESGNSFR